MVITIIGLVAFVAFGSDDEGDGGGDTAGTDVDTTQPAGGAALSDRFDRADSSDGLGIADTGQQWETISGVWGIKDQQAALIEANPDGNRSLAVIDMGASSGTIQATGPKMTNGWGLVFRYRSPFNYWYISGSADYASYNVAKVTRAADSDEITTEVVRQINLANAKDGAVVKIVLRGEAIEIYLDGKLREQIFDRTLSADTRVGLLAVGEAPIDARWDDFTATPDLTVAIPVPNAGTGNSIAPAGTGSSIAPANGGTGGGTTIDIPAPTVAGDEPPPTTEAGGDGAAGDGG